MSFSPGSIFGAAGSIISGTAQAGAARYNAAIATQNATIAEQQGEAAAQSVDRNARRKIGSMIAGFGASGVDQTTGSATDVLADSVRMATLDKLTTKYNYALRAVSYRNQAKLDETNANNAETAMVFNAMANLTGGYGSPIPNFSATSGEGSRGKRATNDYNYEDM